MDLVINSQILLEYMYHFARGQQYHLIYIQKYVYNFYYKVTYMNPKQG